MLKIRYTNKFKKDFKTIIKRGYDSKKLETILHLLVQNKPLSEKNKDHNLSGNWGGFRECHIEPDWLLIYKIEHDIVTLTLMRTGTHSDLF